MQSAGACVSQNAAHLMYYLFSLSITLSLDAKLYTYNLITRELISFA